MEARNRTNVKGAWFKDTYHPRQVFTQTHFLMTHYLEGNDSQIRRKLAAIHPDKLRAYPELASFSEACWAQVDKERKRYGHVARAWQLGQWYALSPQKPAAEQQALEVYGIAEKWKLEEPSIIEEPSPLGLGVISLHRAYLDWARQTPSLKLGGQPLDFGPQHRFH